jgi:hypothetical protein
MSSLSRVCALAIGMCVMSACQDSPTAPDLQSASTIGIAIVPDPTLVTFNSASCAITNAAIGASSCSYNISNPAQNTLILSVEVLLTASYQCVNPHSGRIASTQTRELESIVQQFGLSAATLTGTNIALPPPFLPTDLTGKQKKENACRGNGVVHNLSYSIEYWDVSVVTVTGTLRASCFGSDDRFGCLT